MAQSRTSQGSSPIISALLLVGSLGFGIWRLIASGRMAWPPHGLIAGLSTLAGCVALVGPLILLRSGSLNGELGELAWMTAGVLIWICDLEAVIRGDWRTVSWTTPIGARTLGLVTLAVLIAGWKCGLRDWRWSWTNVTGWLLASLWVSVAVSSYLLGPAGRSILAVR